MKVTFDLSVPKQIAELGISIGDTIERRQVFKDGFWAEYRQTLLWVGDQIAVWRTTTRNQAMQEWQPTNETASKSILIGPDWTLINQSPLMPKTVNYNDIPPSMTIDDYLPNTDMFCDDIACLYKDLVTALQQTAEADASPRAYWGLAEKLLLRAVADCISSTQNDMRNESSNG